MKNSLKRTVFDFVWTPQDSLMAAKPPRRFSRVEIALPDRIADGVIERILWVEQSDSEGEMPRYMLRISTDADLSQLTPDQLNDVGVKVWG